MEVQEIFRQVTALKAVYSSARIQDLLCIANFGRILLKRLYESYCGLCDLLAAELPKNELTNFLLSTKSLFER